jgi:hypothetical protein
MSITFTGRVYRLKRNRYLVKAVAPPTKKMPSLLMTSCASSLEAVPKL